MFEGEVLTSWSIALQDLTIPILVYGLPLALVYLFHIKRRRQRDIQNIDMLTTSVNDGMTEPPSLHPLIDPTICGGCNACVKSCPEKTVLGVIAGKAHLVEPTKCIGHGACKTACPFGAISLVFGTEKRGVDIPNVSTDFQTTVPGIYIAGELGGMGLIYNAVTQGVKAVKAIKKDLDSKHSSELDLLIIGSGPAGIAASLASEDLGLRYTTLEQDTFGGTVAHFPRNKIVMTRPVELPLIGKVNLRETTKESLMKLWENIRKKTKMRIHENERVERVEKSDKGFHVKTSRNEYLSARILLTIGRRGTPRKLGVEGEEQSKVVYRLIDPAQYQNQHVLVVGGGDAALEAACSIAEEEGTTVTLSYRSPAFSRAKKRNRDIVDDLVSDGKLDVLLKSNVQKILADSVSISTDEKGVEAVELLQKHLF
ncbi:MAG: NAD(P)-binding domain-containing protein [gamma proteobacterium symbiont of Bathyaustriella thionipta]|nr:NAD(P)-binding domain-containing protein [gamma proteobacterium symbiont of Bathyaustriella thionipta]MCU7951610.1 NAD(P)-binding domain-containing protein [gamma proteobacterium symbiont of Bathyaustriella thionipta]MCU7958208.1 NAD(P)-binding domain-containing protein [gamma proteobacterium symbiont of Bathyaustriella thionipta]MCU7966984.1 NAD(P)-binding domain-containing protein [gamma proteobacterium symbiont of Bathyaustriella thionipta]